MEGVLRNLEAGTFIKYDNEVFIAVGMDPESKKVLCISKSGNEIYLELDTKVELIPYQVNGGSEYE